MCTLLVASVPKLLEPFEPGKMSALVVSSARHDAAAVTVSLIGVEKEALDIQTHDLGSLQIQDSKKETK